MDSIKEVSSYTMHSTCTGCPFVVAVSGKTKHTCNIHCLDLRCTALIMQGTQEVFGSMSRAKLAEEPVALTLSMVTNKSNAMEESSYRFPKP